ncbi:hypothetical protein CG51_12440 [Haematobacter missouriensis]|nr:hypothetical protein CG51_12440 [Haematobacter missouriensis]
MPLPSGACHGHCPASKVRPLPISSIMMIGGPEARIAELLLRPLADDRETQEFAVEAPGPPPIRDRQLKA